MVVDARQANPRHRPPRRIGLGPAASWSGLKFRGAQNSDVGSSSLDSSGFRRLGPEVPDLAEAHREAAEPGGTEADVQDAFYIFLNRDMRSWSCMEELLPVSRIRSKYNRHRAGGDTEMAKWFSARMGSDDFSPKPAGRPKPGCLVEGFERSSPVPAGSDKPS